MFRPILCIIFTVFLTYVAGNQTYQNNTIESDHVWINLRRLTKILLRSCTLYDSQKAPPDLIFLLQDCLKENILRMLNKALDNDVIEIIDGVEFVKYRDFIDNRTSESNSRLDNNLSWKNALLNRIMEILETRVLRIRLEHLMEQDVEKGARFRRRRNNMMPFMVFGVVAMGMILIPMGFKFLTILGGKALLLAKMALILSSIQGLKKVATSGFNYGLYHAPPANPWHHDRQWYHENSGPTIQWETHIDDIPDEQLDLLHNTHLRT